MSMWKPLVIGGLTAPKPVIQDGIRVDVSLSSLAGAIAAEEGVGVISTVQIGFQEPDFKKNPLEANLQAIEEEFQKTREVAPRRIIGFNIMAAMKGYTLYVKEAIKAEVDIIISEAGLPITLPELVQGAKTKIAPIVPSAESAVVILKTWDKEYQVVPGLVVIERPLAGGHLGLSVEQLEKIGASSENREETYRRADHGEEVKSILKIVKEYMEKCGKKISVVTAGGVHNHEDMLHQMELGVDDAQVAARSVTTEEYDTPEAYKQAYIHARQENVVITKGPVGMPGRVIKNPFLNLVSKEKQPVEHCYQCLEGCDHKTIPYCITRALVDAAEGDTDRALVFCGSSVYRTEKTETVTDVLNDLLGDAH